MKPALDTIHLGDNLTTMKTWPDSFVQTCVTSPPYFGLRDYGVEGQLGLEATPEQFVEKLVAVFSEVRRVLRDDGTLWLNLGDSYNTYGGNRGESAGINKNPQSAMPKVRKEYGLTVKSLKNKDLIGIPWMVAFALRADGWYLRSDIIWAKKNCMPESVTDRPTKGHEHIFLLSKSDRYFYDHQAIKEPVTESSIARVSQNDGNPNWNTERDRSGGVQNEQTMDITKMVSADGMRNKRDVWHVATQPFKEAHFATFPPDLIAPCILAGAPRGGLVLDPFMGAGTTALVAARHDRRFLGCELNPEYLAIAHVRIANEVAQEKML